MSLTASLIALPRHARGILAFARFVQDFNKLPEIFRMAEGLATEAQVAAVVAKVRMHAGGAAAIRDRYRPNIPQLQTLLALPVGSFGRAYADHMHTNGLDPSSIDLRVRSLGPDSDYVRLHLRETHDLWHAALGIGADVSGELGLQAFYLAQIPARLSAAILAGGVLNQALYAMQEKDARMSAIARGWMLGERTPPLFGVRWGDHWSTPLVELRAELGIVLAEPN